MYPVALHYTFYEGGIVTSAGWQATLCDPMRHVSSRSGVATLRTAIHLLLTYLHCVHRRRKQGYSRQQTSPLVLHPGESFQRTSYSLISLRQRSLTGGSVAEWLACWTRAQNAWPQIAAI